MTVRRGFNRSVLLGVAALIATGGGCSGERRFARAVEIREMAETIGGPAAIGRPGDLLLENDRIRAIVHGRHNERSTLPLSNGSLVDLDIQRPHHQYGDGKGADAFYELGPMVNLKVNGSRDITVGDSSAIGAAPAPASGCARVSVSGRGESFMGVLGLLDLVMKRRYPAKELQMVTDYDVCPGEPVVRLTTTARFYGKGEPVEFEPLTTSASLLTTLLGDSLDIDCAKQACPAGSECDDLLVKLSLGSLSTEMKRCRKPETKIAGVLAGDLLLMSGKVSVFIPGAGFDHETFIRGVFDSGGDIFSNPLSLDYVAAVGDEVSYLYFEPRGKVMIPVFSESFTVSMTNRFACPRSDPGCLEGKELRYHRMVVVGQGDVASALATYYKLRDIPTGQLEGSVIDRRTQQPVSRTEVFALRLPSAWEKFSDQDIGDQSYEALVAANREESKSDALPLGHAGIVSHFRTDVGLDTVKDGSFSGPLPPGRYVLVTRDAKRPASRLVPIRVEAGRVTQAALYAGEHGTLQLEVQDATGRGLPSKLTIGHCFAECARDEDCGGATPHCHLGSGQPCTRAADCAAGETCTPRGCRAFGPTAGLCTPAKDGSYRDASQCRPDQLWDAERGTCACPTTGRLPLELGGGRRADGTDLIVHAASGSAVAELPPGTYQVVVSRGFEYETKRRFVTVRPATVTRLTTSLAREVDTAGWISADFHVHGPGSVDSGLDHAGRVKSYAVEGVELLSASDHDQLTDYGPTIDQLGLRSWVKSQVGLEISPLDYGHFLGFPLLFDENAELNGGFHWREDLGDKADPDWKNLPPQALYNGLRAHGEFGADDTVIAVAHFYDHFTFYDVDPWTLELPNFNVQAMTNLVLLPTNFSGDFDALEAFNGKGMDMLRRPTVSEVRWYNARMSEVLSDPQASYEARQAAWSMVSAEAQRTFMLRSEAEQQLAIDYKNVAAECRCVADADCGGTGYYCDERTGGCVRACSDDAECSEALVAARREACLPLGGLPGNEARRTCQPTTVGCTRNADCMVGLAADAFGKTPERCVAVDSSKPQERSCQLSCAEDGDCKGDERRPSCREGRCQAPQLQVIGDSEPCRTLRGTIDDWFQLLNRGMRRTLLGNSDSHDLYGVEGGLPRNFVRSSTDLPGTIDRREIARNVKRQRVLASYGPFVELTVDGAGLGEQVTVAAGAEVKLHLRVQSPRWFDVDRIELYRNGELLKTVSGKVDCVPGDPECIKVPNDAVVNYDQTLTDRPERDSWYAVVAAGLDGKTLAPVYSSTPVARLGMFELIQRLTPLLPPLRGLRTPFSPSITVVRPYAVTNPVWVDVGGDGFTPVQSLPGWATEHDRQRVTSQARGLSVRSDQLPAEPDHDHASGSSHDHRRGIGRLRGEAQDFLSTFPQGQISPAALKRAFDSLRFIH